jgi:hypothetical protein
MGSMWIQLVLSFLLGSFGTLIGLQLTVPLLVHLLGERRFADSGGLDGCGLALFSGITTALLTSLWAPGPWWRPVAIWPWVLLWLTLFCLLQLWLKGIPQRRQQFTVAENHVYSLTPHAPLSVLCVTERTDYQQTDAYFGYMSYHLLVHTTEGAVFTNSYTTKEEWIQVREALLPLAPQLDLSFVCPLEPKSWQIAALAPEWLPLLVGRSSATLPGTSLAFWHSLLRPRLGKDEERPVTKEQLLKHLAALEEAFGPELSQQDELARNLETLKIFAHGCQGNPRAMTDEQFERLCHQAAPEARQRRGSIEDGILVQRMV